LTLSFTYEFDFWGKNRNLFRAALGRQKAQEAETAQVELLVTTGMAQAFFALKTNLIRKELYLKLYEVRKGIFELQALLQEKALYSLLVPLDSRENLLEAEKLLYAIDQEIATDRHLINILAGRGPDTPLEIDGCLSPLSKTLPLPENLSLDLLSRRPDLMAQIWRVEALAHEVGAAKADFFPNINLTALLGLESVLYRHLFESRSKTGSLEPAIHLPIFTAGSIRANVRAKKAAFDEAVYDYNNLILRSSQEVADLLSLAQSIFQQKQSQEEIVDDAVIRLEITLLREEKGLDDLFASYASEEEVILKNLDDISLLYSEYLAVVKLIKALGGGYQSDYLPLQAKEKT
jgi:NodT family efflux transporter outer membrane factor (OMF) lipoprotein